MTNRSAPFPAVSYRSLLPRLRRSLPSATAALAAVAVWLSHFAPLTKAAEIPTLEGPGAGLIVVCGCDDGQTLAKLAQGQGQLVHGLTTQEADVQQIRRQLVAKSLGGKANVVRLSGGRLPYIDNTVNLFIGCDLGELSLDEVKRVLVPGGKALLRQGEDWETRVKPRPEDLDEWTHYMHDAGNNAVSHDRRVGPPRRLQWTAGPRWSRHHDHMTSVSAMVSAGGRLFTILDEGHTASILWPPRWKVVARDAFNGVVLWKRDIDKWWIQWWPLKSGPANLPRRLVAEGDEVYTILNLLAPVSALDAATGKTLRTYAGTEKTEEIVKSGETLLVLVNRTMPGLDPQPPESGEEQTRIFDGRITNTPMMRHLWAEVQSKKWLRSDRAILAFRADTGEKLWEKSSRVVPLSVAADASKAFFHDGSKIVALDLATGREVFATEPVATTEEFMMSFFGPTLVVRDGVIVFAGGEKLNQAWMGWGRPDQGEDTMTGFSAETGAKLWTAPHPYGGYQCPEDVLVADGLVWTAATAKGNELGTWLGYDLHTGKLAKEIPPTLKTGWFHHRCYRAKATDRFLLPSRNGIELIDLENKTWGINHWVRSACLYGVMPANGLLYTAPHDCACHPQAKLCGFNALAAEPEAGEADAAKEAAKAPRLERGPAFAMGKADGTPDSRAGDWPTYRHDAARSGATAVALGANLVPDWSVELGGKITQPVVQGDLVVVASVESNTIYALGVEDGDERWRYVAGGRVDSPPTLSAGRVVFGSADGYVTCLRAADGALAWRFRAAPADRRLVAFGQLESVWPVHGSVLVEGGDVMFVAGRSFHLDGGVRFYRLSLATGEVLAERGMDHLGEDGQELQAKGGLDMPVALPDILGASGDSVFMRAQLMDRDGNRTKTREHHLFAPYGFLDDSWFHRAYWVFGKDYFGGCGGYPRAGKMFPSGRAVVFDDTNVYAYGREQKYYRWITPLEFHLFASPRMDVAANASAARPVGKRAAKGGKNRGRPAVELTWSVEVPILVRAMVKSGDVLLLTGPADLIDEEEMVQRIPQPDAMQALAEQDAVYSGAKGALLWAVSAKDGTKLAEMKLDDLPTFDGMSVGSGRLFIGTADGHVKAMKGAR